MKAKLEFVEQGDEREYVLGPYTLIGRGRDSHVAVKDSSASKQHASIRLRDGEYVVEDLGSKNGTLVNGEMVMQQSLKPGDVITIGSYQFVFIAAEEPKTILFDEEDEENSMILDEVEAPTGTTISWDFEPKQDHSLQASVAAFRQRLNVLQQLCELTASLDEPAALKAQSTRLLMRAFPQADRCSMLTLQEQPRALRLECQETRDMHIASNPSRQVCNHAIAEGKCVLSRNMSTDPRFDPSVSLERIGSKSVMCAPLKVADDVRGLLYLESVHEENPFNSDDLQLLATAAADIALGIENARLHQERIRMERLAAVGQAIAGMAHCVKNVLNSINCGAHIVNLSIEKTDWPTLEKGWGILNKGNDFLRTMVLDMLAYSKPRQPSYEETNIAKFLQSTADGYQEQAKASGVALTVEAAEGLPPVMLDKVAMQRCFNNLVTNAIEACADKEDGGAVRLLGSPSGLEKVKIVVEDNGSGMPDEVKQKLFQAFFSTKGSRGTGLGLPVVAKTVEEHNGTVTVESEVGKGTSFIIEIPYRPPDQSGTSTGIHSP